MASLATQLAYIRGERLRALQPLAQATKASAPALPDTTREPLKSLAARLGALLAVLEQGSVCPELRATQIETGLKLVGNADPRFRFPEQQAVRARALLERWDAENWGELKRENSPVEIKEEEESEPESVAHAGPSRQRNSTAGNAAERPIKPVPHGHAVWGTHGIMHGLARPLDGSKTAKLDPAFQHERRNYSRYGHNGIPVGQWFPRQLSALFHGAHGSSMAGISGDSTSGAYSIVVSGKYNLVDQDNGEHLWYSGANSEENRDPNQAPVNTGTRALSTSIASENPVRVLRSGNAKSRWCPIEWIRYDGLYKVVSVRNKRNARGGLYEQFELQRLPGQMSLDLCTHQPSALEQQAFARISLGY